MSIFRLQNVMRVNDSECEKNEGVAATVCGGFCASGFAERIAQLGLKGLKNGDIELLWGVCSDYFSASSPTAEAKAEPKAVMHHDVRVEIRKMVKRTYKNGREKREYGVVFAVDGVKVEMPFGLKDEAMIYVCALLRQKKGERLYLHEFYRNSKGRKSKYTRESSQVWLKGVYDTLYSNSSKDFAAWERGVRNVRLNRKTGEELSCGAMGHGLAQAVSHLRRNIKITLAEWPEVAAMCTVATSQDENKDTFYGLGIEPDMIVLPEELDMNE